MIHPQANIGKVKFWCPELSNIGNCTIGDGCVIHSHVWIGDGVTIGKRCKIEAFAFIPPGVTIGDDVFIGPHVCFTNDRKMGMEPDWKPEATLVENGVDIGASATILPGITLHKGCTIGAGSVVVRDIGEFCVAFGNPARVHRLT